MAANGGSIVGTGSQPGPRSARPDRASRGIVKVRASRRAARLGQDVRLIIVAAVMTGAAALLSACGHPATGAGSNPAAAVFTCGGSWPTGNWIGRLAPGRTAADIQAAGITVVTTIPDTTGKTYVILRHAPANPPAKLQQADVAPLLSSGVMAAAVGYDWLASEPDLHSCDMKLSDRPAAQPYLTAAENTALADGMATQADLSSTASPFLISDDPLDPNSLIVTLDVPGSRVTSLPSGAPTNLYTQRSIIELVNRQTAAVTGIGQGDET